VVLAAPGYPGPPRLGAAVDGLDAALHEDEKVFHGGTRESEGQVVTAGGRVLTVCALGEDLAAARARAYERLRGVVSPGSFYRKDIGHRALARS